MKHSKKKKVAKKKVAPAAKKKVSKAGIMPLGDRVLIKPQAAETMTSFGILLPEASKEKPETGVVAAVGPGRRNERGERIAMDVKVGDFVYFKKPWDEPIKVGGIEYYVVSESEITLIQK